MDKLDKRFEDVISGKIRCNRLSITYIAIKAKKNGNSYAVIPVYLFDITQEIIDKKTNETYKDKYNLFLDAQTGEWIK